MSKKLILAIIILITLLIGGVNLINGNSKKEPAVNTSSLSNLEGKQAPDFTLKNQNGQTFTLSSLRGKKVVLFFSEGIMCYPACWNQIAALATDQNLQTNEIISVSVVADNPEQWASAFAKMPDLKKGTLLFDTDKKISDQYGMLSLSSSMHKGSMPGHTYLILDRNGIIKYTLDDPTMGIQNEKLISELKKI